MITLKELFDAISYYRKWRDNKVKETAIAYLKKVNPNHHLLKDWIEPYEAKQSQLKKLK